LDKAQEVKKALVKQNLRVHIDARDEFTPGYKFHDWEMKGVPIRAEIGPKDLAKGKMVLVRRDRLEKFDLTFENTESGILDLLDKIQQNLFENAKNLLREKTRDVTDFEYFKSEIEKGGFLNSPWCGEPKCEEVINETTGADIRVIPFNVKDDDAPCLVCKNLSKTHAIFGRGY
jgi:prolyl-tRNA synthetase